MYKWYKSAAICYVYLDDLPSNCPRLVKTHTYKVITTKLVGCNARIAKLFTLEGPGKTYRSSSIKLSLSLIDNKKKTGLN